MTFRAFATYKQTYYQVAMAVRLNPLFIVLAKPDDNFRPYDFRSDLTLTLFDYLKEVF